MIYLDNAATTLQKPQAVYDAVLDAMKTLGNSGRGFSGAALGASRMIYEARRTLCDFFGGSDPSRLVFTSNATEALNMAIQGMFLPGEHVITTQLEHNSVLRPLYAMQKKGVELTIAASGQNGTADFDAIEAAIRANTKAIVCTHASNLTGNLTDMQRMGELARRHGLFLIVDASQTAGVIPIDVKQMHIDVLCFTGHKSLFGPQGTGGLYIGEGAEIKPLKSGGTGVHSFLKTQPEELPEHLEAGTLNGHGIAGLLAGVQEIQKITGVKYDKINIIGGGSNAAYLNELTAKYTGVGVHAGPGEATAIGNILSQMLEDGTFADLKEARNCVADSFEIKIY